MPGLKRLKRRFAQMRLWPKVYGIPTQLPLRIGRATGVGRPWAPNPDEGSETLDPVHEVPVKQACMVVVGRGARVRGIVRDAFPLRDDRREAPNDRDGATRGDADQDVGAVMPAS